MSLQRANAVIRIELGPERLILLQNVENVAQHLQANGVLGRNYCCAARIEAHAGHFAEEIAGMKLRYWMVVFEVDRSIDLYVFASGIFFFALMFLSGLQLAG